MLNKIKQIYSSWFIPNILQSAVVFALATAANILWVVAPTFNGNSVFHFVAAVIAVVANAVWGYKLVNHLISE